MALQKTLIFDTEVELTAAYIIVTNINISYFSTDPYAIVDVAIYKDATAYSNEAPEHITFTHKCIGAEFTAYFNEPILNDLDSTPLIQAYAWLLTLSLYSGATEV